MVEVGVDVKGGGLVDADAGGLARSTGRELHLDLPLGFKSVVQWFPEGGVYEEIFSGIPGSFSAEASMGASE